MKTPRRAFRRHGRRAVGLTSVLWLVLCASNAASAQGTTVEVGDDLTLSLPARLGLPCTAFPAEDFTPIICSAFDITEPTQPAQGGDMVVTHRFLWRTPDSLLQMMIAWTDLPMSLDEISQEVVDRAARTADLEQGRFEDALVEHLQVDGHPAGHTTFRAARSGLEYEVHHLNLPTESGYVLMYASSTAPGLDEAERLLIDDVLPTIRILAPPDDRPNSTAGLRQERRTIVVLGTIIVMAILLVGTTLVRTRVRRR